MRGPLAFLAATVAAAMLHTSCLPDINLAECMAVCRVDFESCSEDVERFCTEDACLVREASLCLDHALGCYEECVAEAEDKL